MNLLCDQPQKHHILANQKILMELREVLDEVLDDLLQLSLLVRVWGLYELIHEEVFVNLLHGVILCE
jgi:hypothetical protein